MTITSAPTEEDLFTALRSFLIEILPGGVELVRGQGNRVPEPRVSNFVVMTTIRQPRLATNVDTSNDCAFVGSIDDVVMTVSSISFGTLAIGRRVFGKDVQPNTIITAGSGGVGTYAVTPAQTVPSQAMAAGVTEKLQPVMSVIQLDIHGPASADNAQVISTLLNDEYAVERFAALADRIIPLFASDPRQLPFINDQNQYENRWVIEASIQINSVLSTPQQYADALSIELVSVEAKYPA